jgi:hypothetical protein
MYTPEVKIAAAFCDTNFLEGICHDLQGGSLQIWITAFINISMIDIMICR